MIGQNKLKEKLNNLTLTTLPNSLILVGEYGCGKHTLLNKISNMFNLVVEDISVDIDDEKVLEMQEYTFHKIYIIDSNKISEKSQNTILKFLEEPTEYAHIIILCESINGLLSTIVNRCKIWYFEKYTINELKQVVDNLDTMLYNIFNTPGKLLEAKELNINTYIDDSEKIFNYIDRALISNILLLPNKLSYKEKEENKLSFNIFVTILLNKAFDFYNNKIINFESYLLTNSLYVDSKIFSIDKQKLYERYLIDLKNELKRFKNSN